MSPTPTERRILQERAAKKTGALLVPILEELLEVECIPETKDDFRFMEMLVRARGIKREKGVFSPSMLGSCVRQAYFAKRGEEKLLARNPRTNGFFLKGNFIHFQWQFTLWKAHVAGMLELVPVPAESKALDFYGDGTRPGVEVRVSAPGNEDFKGTIDALVAFQPQHNPVHVVDFKGINVIDFQRTIKRGAKKEYRTQIVGYGQNVNLSDLPYEVDECLLVCENKAGPMNSASASPLALHETRVPIPDHIHEVTKRLRTLRWYDDRNEIPPPECVSTTHMGYQECPFNRFCRDEVRARQREREGRASKSRRNVEVARPIR